MAQYQHLPIYKVTYELLQHITRVTKEFPRDYKHSLAAKLYNRVAERFYRRFIHDSYACIPGKGALMAADRLQAMTRSASQNFTAPTWFLKADVANFFVSIDKQVLDAQLARRIAEPWWMDLCRRVLHHDPTSNVRVRSADRLMARVPAHKSLFNAHGRGLPIGNLSSQFFANVYLDPVDQFAKRHLKLRWYARYVDDMVALGHDPGSLHAAAGEMDAFVSRELGLRLHPNKTEINRIERGINFLGYIVRPHARYVRRSTVLAAHQRIAELTRAGDATALRATVNSYLGLMRHANTWRERDRLARALKRRGWRVDPARRRLIVKRTQQR